MVSCLAMTKRASNISIVSSDASTSPFTVPLCDLDATIEQQMPMTGASMFWLEALHDCDLDRPLSLPYDRHRLSNEHRSGRGTSVSFDFGQDLSDHVLAHASSNSINLKYLTLALYYSFLFKMTNGDRDLCIEMNTHGRYKDEFQSVIGMFVNAIPLRCELDPHWSSHQLFKRVQSTITGCIKYSYFPLQRILAQHPNMTKAAFLDTSFEFQCYEANDAQEAIFIGNSRLFFMPFSLEIKKNEIRSKFDFILRIRHDVMTNELSCAISASLDLFNVETMGVVAQRFHSMLNHLFLLDGSAMNKAINEIPIALPDERQLVQSVNNTEISYSVTSCIHHEFAAQAMKYSQKLAVELDDQSLTYSELLHYVQVLSLDLLDKHHVVAGEVICQCMERSVSMVSE